MENLYKNKPFFLLLLIPLLIVLISFNSIKAQNSEITEAEIVNIPDSGLEAAIRIALDHPSGEITVEMMAEIKYLYAEEMGIVDLSGLEYAVELEELDLRNNLISNLSGLDLPALRFLNLGNNQISDLSGLAEAILPNLEELGLHYNRINSLSGMADWDLPELSFVELEHNQITDIEDLAEAELPALEGIDLGYNQIIDVSALAGTDLPNLWGLGLHHNQISDISVFTEVNLPKLGGLNLSHNLISDISVLVNANFSGLEYLDLRRNQIMELSVLFDLEVPELKWLWLEGNYLNINPGSSARNIIDEFIAKDIYVEYVPQRPFYGDIDKNEIINVTDAILVLRHITGLIDLNHHQLIRARVADGETLTVKDAIFILRHVVGLINEFPVAHFSESYDR